MTFERRVRFVIDVFILALVLLTVRLVYWQLVRGSDLLPGGQAAGGPANMSTAIDSDRALQALLNGGAPDALQNLPQPVIQRLSDQLAEITRGSIYDRNGNLLASDRLDGQGNRSRYYNEASLANVIGSVSGLGIGISGLERSYNAQLLGADSLAASFERMLHLPVSGEDLVLSIDSDLQRQAEEALGGRAGSITVLDAHSGAVLAMASLPRFDPNRFLEPGYLAGLLASCDGSPQCSGFLLNRSTQALYSPGSTWKTVALIAALDSGSVAPDAVFDFGTPLQSPNGPYYVYRVDGGEISDPNHSEARLNLEMSYAKSANAAFAQIGNEMPPKVLIDYAARFGFSAPANRRFPFEFDFSPGQLATDVNRLYKDNYLRAVTAIGQGELLASPLNMTMVVLAVYNQGALPVPYLVSEVRPHGGSAALFRPAHTELQNLMKPETAATVRRMMETVVKAGSGTRAAIAGAVVGGKTGTAQVGGDNQPHAWFSGFAEEGERAVVVTVMIENGGEGSRVAAPIFARIAAAALHIPASQKAPQTASQPTDAPSPVPTRTPIALTQVAAPPRAAATGEAATATSTGLPPPDIPYQAGKVDFTDKLPSCPGNQKVVTGSGKFIWPRVYQAISGTKFQEGHPGIDLSTPEGAVVYAADAGSVIFAGWSDLGYGNTIVIDHGNGYKTLYAHLSQVSQYCGASVRAGQIIGLSGSTGNSSGPHLHFEVRVPGGYLNPFKVLPAP